MLYIKRIVKTGKRFGLPENLELLNFDLSMQGAVQAST
jgi:hypothetical protein